MTTTTRAAPQAPQGIRSLGRLGRELAAFAGVLVVLALAAVTTPGFYSQTVVTLVLFQAGLIGVTAIGQTLVLLVGGIDLSIGAVIAMSAVITATYTGGSDARLLAAIGLSLLAGAAVGVVNALLVVGRQVPPFVATFATFVLVQGVIIAWTRGAPSGSIPDALGPLGTGRLLGVPVPMWLFLATAVVVGLVLSRSGLGRRVYAVGSNLRAARLSGIRTGAVIGGCYVASAVLAVVAGLISAGYIGYVDAQLSRTLNLESVAAAVIGGIALTGGRGRITQTVAGVALLSVLLTWMMQLGTGPGALLIVQGAVILLAVWLQNTGGATRSLRRRPHQEGTR